MKLFKIALMNLITAIVLVLIFWPMQSDADVLSAETGTAGLEIEGADSTNSVTLTWTAPGDDGMSGTATIFDLRHRTDGPITDGNWSSSEQVTSEPMPQVAGTVQTMVVTGLTPGTTYYWAIKTGDEVPNWSGLSNVVKKGTTALTVTGSSFYPMAINYSYSADGLGDIGLYEAALGRFYIAYNRGNHTFSQENGPAPGLSWLDGWGKQTMTAKTVATTDTSTEDESESAGPAIPGTLLLNQNYPNPFNPTTTISFTLSEPTRVTLDIYNTLGQRVAVLIDDQQLSAGEHSVEWNAGSKASGFYIYRLSRGVSQYSKKMILLK